MHLWEGLGNNFIPDLHGLFFGFPVLEDVKHLSPSGRNKKVLENVASFLLAFMLGITFFLFTSSYPIWTFLTREYK